MGFLIPPPETAEACLRALRTVATVDGKVADLERRVIAAMAHALGRPEIDVDALAPITPDEVAAAIPDEQQRRQALSCMILTSMADAEASSVETEVIERFAAALDVEMPYVKDLRRLTSGHLTMMRFDLMRRVWPREKIVDRVRRDGVGWLVKTLGVATGLQADEALNARYEALASYPDGTLGREYHRFIRRNKFSLPGEIGAAPEIITFHDLTHVLTGYGTTSAGEMQVAFFHAGCKRVDPYFFPFFVLLQFHMGVRITPVAAGERDVFHPEHAIAALERGMRCTFDPLDTWDPWAGDMRAPVRVLRERYGIGEPPVWADIPRAQVAA